MRHQKTITVLVTLLLLPFEGLSSQLNIEPKGSSIERLNEAETSYKACRKEAFKKAKKQPKPKKIDTLKAEIKFCREQFPSYPYMQKCKKSVLEKYKKDANVKTRIQQCRNISNRLAFDPNSINPATFIGKTGFFAGAGLDYAINVSSLEIKKKVNKSADWGNFSCSSILNVATGEENPQHLLFGNQIKSFKPFGQIKPARLNEILSSAGIEPKKGAKSIKIKDWGEIVFDESSSPASASNFFPVAACTYNRPLGDIYKSIDVYYLNEEDASKALPYFAVSFYKEKAKVDYKKFAMSLRSSLKGSYKVQHKKANLRIIGEAPFTQFDKEGDPFDLCTSPRQHSYVGIISLYPGTRFLNYFLLSNIGNLCRYGDLLAERLLHKNKEAQAKK